MEASTTQNKENLLEHQIDEFFTENTEYVQFLEKGGINLESYSKTLKNYAKHGFRCVRIKSKKYTSTEINNIIQEIESNHNKISESNTLSKTKVQIHPLFEDLIIMPKSYKISNILSYRKGQIYGIEVSSAVVVKSLNPQPGENILDMCCSPGAKLAYIGDLVNSEP